MTQQQQHGGSEVARLRQDMATIAEAMFRGLHGYASVAKHETIEHKYDALGASREQLEVLVGRDASMQMMVEVFEEVESDTKTRTTDGY